MSSIRVIYYQCGTHWVDLEPGKYKLEVWGAQGGGFTEASCEGGRGAYAKGILTLYEVTSIFINIGENGYDTYHKNTCNGGGLSNYNEQTQYKTKSGGGSTDIRISDTNLQHRVIVASGGGGSSLMEGKCGKGGDAGAEVGFDGQCPNDARCTEAGGGATQTQGGLGTTNGQKGTFYFGGNNTCASCIGCGGGGGWFGGGAGNLWGSGGGGGSSYVFDGVNSEYQSLDKKYCLEKTVLIAGNEEMPDPTNLKTTEIGHTGSGAVRITFLTNQEFNYDRSLLPMIALFMFSMDFFLHYPR